MSPRPVQLNSRFRGMSGILSCTRAYRPMALSSPAVSRRVSVRRFARESIFQHILEIPFKQSGLLGKIPGAKEPVFGGESELRVIETGASHKKLFSLRGTDSSNPPPSSGESLANLTSSIRAPNSATGSLITEPRGPSRYHVAARRALQR